MHFRRLDMADINNFHFVTVGTSLRLVRNLWDRIAARGGFKASHIVHPTYDRRSWTESGGTGNCHFFRDDLRSRLPPADSELLSSLEGGDVPTIHNMILSDRVVSKLAYAEALSYATLLTRRLFDLYRKLDPSVVIGDFDAMHSALGLGVARKLGIPWFALTFSTIPPGSVALCTGLTPATAVTLEPSRRVELRSYAEEMLRGFESMEIRAPAYLPPRLLSPQVILEQTSSQMKSLWQVLKRRRLGQYRKYSDFANSYALTALFKEAFRLRRNALLMPRRKLLKKAGIGRYAFFGLHMQPEASIDVFAHFFSNQLRVIELMSRSLPPTHTLLVKLHKSDVPNYSREHLARLSRFPGVELVSPYADTHQLIRGADIVFAIQGTIGLEAALLGRPVVMFAESPISAFPSASAFGKAADLPRLVRAKLIEIPPARGRIVEAYAAYLAPYYPATDNDWSRILNDTDIDNYLRLFRLMENHIQNGMTAIRTLHP